MTLQRHFLSAAWGDMPAAEFEELVADIRANGQREPIVLLDGQVLDGWHRWRACGVVGIPCTHTVLPDDIEPVAWVISRNAHRRTLNASQKALAIVACRDWAPAGRPENPAPGAGFRPATEESMAQEANVSPRTIRQAKVVAAKAAPEVKEAVQRGELSVKRASEVAQLPAAKQVKALAEPRPEPAKLKAKPAEDDLAEQAFEGTDLATDLERAHKEIEALTKRMAVAEAIDQKAEALKWHRLYENAVREQGTAMDKARRAEQREAWAAGQLKRCGKAVGETDPDRIAPAVEAMARKLKPKVPA